MIQCQNSNSQERSELGLEKVDSGEWKTILQEELDMSGVGFESMTSK